MDDVEHMRRAMALAAAVRSEPPPPTPGWAAVVVPAARDRRRRRTVLRGGDGAAGRPPRRGRGARRGGRGGPRRHPLRHAGAVRPPRADAALHRRHHRGGGGPGRDRHRGPRPPGGRARRRGTLRAGIEVDRGGGGRARSSDQLAPYLKHRTTGQPWVVLKMAASLDARTAAPDGTSRWITGEAARRDVHRLRARSDAVLVGAGTVRADDPELTVRLDDGADRAQPLRVVLGPGARPAPGCTRPSSSRATSTRCWPSSAAAGCSSCWSRGAPPWPTISTPPAWWTATSCTWRRSSSGATTAARSSPVPGLAQLGTCGEGRLVSVEKLGEDLRVEVAA